MSQEKVLVIGGGVAGALTSLFLKQNGFSPEVYERVTTPWRCWSKYYDN